jgi:hypothetical protein
VPRDRKLHELLFDTYADLRPEHLAEALEKFTQKQLSYQGDRLDAFMGVFNRFCVNENPDHRAALSGMPRK